MVAPILGCFCKAEKKKHAMDFFYDVSGALHQTSIKNKKVPTCSHYFSDLSSAKFIGLQLTGFLFVTNFALRFICTTMIKSLRISTVSTETKAITMVIFFATFVNTCILLSIKNANFADLFGKDSWINKIFNGKETDFSVNWYHTVGLVITQTLLIQSFTPLIQLSMNYCILNTMRCLDRGFTLNPSKTRQASIQNYIDLHSGPIYALNYRFSAILLQISVTALFGAGIPLLYPVGALSFFIMLMVERLSLAYFYREPPCYDEQITIMANKVIKVIAHFGLVVTFWQLGNRQIFER